ncbi:MAG: hypothetical protein J6K32_04820 [Clostridia bacterium]|nr:hypothetical protein [Clostridia bacterium]
MKRIIRVFLLTVIGLSVFFGALLISSGLQAHSARMTEAASRDAAFDQAEGSAL